MSGCLGFASQHVFNRLGRALLVPIFLQMRARSSEIGPALKMAFVWWRTTLQAVMCEVCDVRVRASRLCCTVLCFAGAHVEANPDKALASSVRREVSLRLCMPGREMTLFLYASGPLHRE